MVRPLCLFLITDRAITSVWAYVALQQWQENRRYQTLPPVQHCLLVSNLFKNMPFWIACPWPSCAKMWSSTKPEVYNVWQLTPSWRTQLAVITVNMHRKFREVWTRDSWDVCTDRHRHSTHSEREMPITILHSSTDRGITIIIIHTT